MHSNITGHSNIAFGIEAARQLGHVFEPGADTCTVCGVRYDAGRKDLEARGRCTAKRDEQDK